MGAAKILLLVAMGLSLTLTSSFGAESLRVSLATTPSTDKFTQAPSKTTGSGMRIASHCQSEDAHKQCNRPHRCVSEDDDCHCEDAD